MMLGATLRGRADVSVSSTRMWSSLPYFKIASNHSEWSTNEQLVQEPYFVDVSRPRNWLCTGLSTGKVNMERQAKYFPNKKKNADALDRSSDFFDHYTFGALVFFAALVLRRSNSARALFCGYGLDDQAMAAVSGKRCFGLLKGRGNEGSDFRARQRSGGVEPNAAHDIAAAA